jgi:hypothetical protein
MSSDRLVRPSFGQGPNLRFTVGENPEELGVAIDVTNQGAATATGVEGMIRLPSGASFVRGDGDFHDGCLDMSYGELAAGASATKSFVINVCGYGDDILFIDEVRLASSELGTVIFGPYQADLMPSPMLKLEVDCPAVADVSDVICVRTTVTNSGRSSADNIELQFAPRGSIIVLPGPMTLESSGQLTALASQNDKTATNEVRLHLGSIPSDSSVTVTATYRIAIPIVDETAGVMITAFEGSTIRALFERDITIDTHAVFHSAHNVLRRIGPPFVSVGSTVRFEGTLVNDGAVSAHAVRVRLAPDSAIDRLDVEAVPAVTVSESFDASSKRLSRVLLFDEIAPARPVSLTVLAHISDSASNDEVAGLRIFLAHDDQGETELTSAGAKVRAVPRFDPSSSLIRIETDERIRAYGSAAAKVVVANEGDAPARGVLVSLLLPDGLNISDVVGARATSASTFAFEEVPPHNAREAAFRLSLVTSLHGTQDLAIRGFLQADGIPALSMAPGLLKTFAQPVFSESSVTVARVTDEDLYSIQAVIRNTGDAAASETTLKLEDLRDGEFAYGTTYVNGKRRYDTSKHRAIILEEDINFEEFAPGTTQLVSFAVVPSGAPAPTVRLRLRWGTSETECMILDARRSTEPISGPEQTTSTKRLLEEPPAITDAVVSAQEPRAAPAIEPVISSPPNGSSHGATQHVAVADKITEVEDSIRLELSATNAWAKRVLKLAETTGSPGGRALAALAFFFPSRVTPQQSAELAISTLGDRLKDAIAATVARRMMLVRSAHPDVESSVPFPVESVLADSELLEQFDRMLDELENTPGADEQSLSASIAELYDPSDALRSNQPKFAVVLSRNAVRVAGTPYSEQDGFGRLASIAHLLPDRVPGFEALETALRIFSAAIIELRSETKDDSLEAALSGIAVQTGALLDEVRELTFARGPNATFVATGTRTASADAG